MVEQLIRNQQVAGSSPAFSSIRCRAAAAPEPRWPLVGNDVGAAAGNVCLYDRREQFLREFADSPST